MNNYREYDADALISDPSDRRWVRGESAEDAHFWTDWLRQNPDRADTVEQAREFLTAVQQQYQSTISRNEIKAGVDRIVAQTQTNRATEPAIIPLNSRRLGWMRWAAAAVLVLAIGLGWVLTRSESGANSVAVSQLSPWVNRTNTSAKPLTLLLTDGSVVTLEPGSRLRYPRRFAGNQRAVTLTGEAFFEVAHNPK